MPPKTPRQTPKKPKDTPRRNRTRSTTGEDELEHTDDPEKIGESKKRKRGKPKEVPRDTTDDNVAEPPNDEVEEVEEEEVQEEVEPLPDNREMVLPAGEWYMPDLKSTTLTQVFKEGRDYVEDNKGKMLYRFEKLEQYTGYEYYLICPFTGKIDLLDTINETCIPIDIQASKDPKPNSVVIAEVTKASERVFSV